MDPTAIFTFLSKCLDICTSIFRQKNTPQMIDNKIAQEKTDLNEKIVSEVEKKDVKKIQTDLTV